MSKSFTFENLSKGQEVMMQYRQAVNYVINIVKKERLHQFISAIGEHGNRKCHLSDFPYFVICSDNNIVACRLNIVRSNCVKTPQYKQKHGENHANVTYTQNRGRETKYTGLV